jgi:hypothetical protein
VLDSGLDGQSQCTPHTGGPVVGTIRIHFVDLPVTLDSTALPPVPIPNARTRIIDFRAGLASSSPDGLKFYDLYGYATLVL